MDLRFVEELLILVEEEQVPDRTLRYALAGAALMDLALQNRIDTDLESLYVTDAAPLGDVLLDPVLSQIADGPESMPCEFWVRRTAELSEHLRAVALNRLEARGIMESDDGGFFSLALRVRHSRRYPTAAGEAAEQEIHSRLMDIIFDNDAIPSPRDIAIISLCHACDLFRNMMTAEEYDEVKGRIELIAGLELSARALTDAIRTMTIAESVAARRIIMAEGGGWPIASGSLPILGHALKINGDLNSYLIEQYLEHGPVFELRAPGNRFVVLAGQEANLFVNREGRSHFRNRETWNGWIRELGGSNLVIGLDGAEHRLLRGTLRNPYSRNYLLRRLPALADVVDRELSQLPEDRPIEGFDLMRRIAVEQITMLTARTSSREYVGDLALFTRYSLMVHALKRFPALAMRLPKVRRAQRQTERLAEAALREHERQPNPEDEPDIVDLLIELHRSHPEFMSASDMLANVMGPFMLGLDSVAATTAFALYSLMEHPDVAERVRREADEAFAAGEPTRERYRQMTAAQGLVMETLRMYPVAAILPPRQVVNSFEFAGYVIPHGTTLLMAPAVPHGLPEFFPDPDKFDIDRYSPERREHVQPGVFSPYGLGHHACMGQGFADVQMALTMAMLMHRVDIAMHPSDYRLKKGFPPRPDRKFKVRITPRQ